VTRGIVFLSEDTHRSL